MKIRHFLWVEQKIWNFCQNIHQCVTGRGRVAGSIDQKYLEQIVRDFNKTLNGETGQEESSSVIFDEPIDIPEPELNQMTTNVFQNSSDDSDWEGYQVEDEFLADLDIVYIENEAEILSASVTFVLFSVFMSHFYWDCPIKFVFYQLMSLEVVHVNMKIALMS